MKKFLSLLLCAVLLLSLVPAHAAEVTDVMIVVKCDEWVSLRETASKQAKRLEKVHLGELVTECSQAENGFIRCSFNGKTGYILEEYLAATEFSMSDGILKNQMVVNCEEWVSLREAPDTSSKRLAKVPLYGIVTRCVSWMGTFVYCEYKGQRGYILSKYLKDADYDFKPEILYTPEKPQKVYPAIERPMEVVNCNESVTLRSKASTSGKELKKVPLGETVTSCVQVSDSFIYCCYDYTFGYIAAKYLQEVEEPPKGFDYLSVFPSYDDFSEIGKTVLDVTAGNGYSIVARRDYPNHETEQMMVVCYDPYMNALWSQTVESEYLTELDMTGAYLAGTEEKPIVVVFVAGKGLTAYKVGPWEDVQWELSFAIDEFHLSGSVCSANDTDGALYLCGYYDAAPICVSADGQLKWQAVNGNTNIYWPYRILIGFDYIDVVYDSYYTDESKCYVIRYSKDGAKLSTSVVDISTLPEEF